MASPRTQATHRLRFAATIGTALLVALSALPAATSHADPRPSLSDVQRQVDALNAQVDVAVEKYAQSKLALATAKRRSAVAESRVRAAEQELRSIRKAMAGVAAAAYKSGGTDQFVQLVNTSTPQTFLDRASSLNRIAASQSVQLAAAATARHRLDSAHRDAAQVLAVQDAIARAMAGHKAAIEAALAQEQHLLGSLKAEERARFDAQRAADARNAALRASRSRMDNPTYNGPASGRARVAVAEAYRKLGSPYVWAASGPNSFDCSGLTMWVWGKAGVSLSHSAAAQYESNPHVSRANIQPGDLVFFGSPIHHVGIYIGNGQMISAPHSGDVVKVQQAFRSDYVGASRP